MYYTYILSNVTHRVLYIGVTSHLEYRLKKHREKYNNESFTSKYNTHLLVYYEEYKYVGDAILREKQLKKWNRSWKIRLIEENNPFWIDLAESW